MKETAIEKRSSTPLKEKGQYAIAFGAIAIMLYFVGFPVFILFFFGTLGFFIWKAFSSEAKTETRKIFEFYLAANEILRDDDRRWYGFEIQETIARGQDILKTMKAPPPLVHFGLGALYQKIGDQSSAEKHLAYVVEENGADESAIVFPTRELREYVRVLRKIERAPGEAPLTSAAVRSLERARKNKGRDLLAASRTKIENTVDDRQGQPALPASIVDNMDSTPTLNESETGRESHDTNRTQEFERGITYRFADFARSKKSRKAKPEEMNPERKTISEVLHDIYDKNVQ